MRVKSLFKYIPIVLLASSIASCTKVINLNLPTGEALPYVDAWITDQSGVQTIKFLKATNYMNSNDADPVTDAQITVTDVTAGKSYAFNYQNGAYIYDAGSQSIGVRGHLYKLNIAWSGQQFEATDTLKRNTTIDSLTSEYKKAENGDKEGYYVKLWAHDVPGAVDYYWIRTYLNGSLNYHVSDMLSADGTFNEDGLTDGYAFIPPFRDGVTAGDNPYNKGDNVKVLIRSLSRDSYKFMQQVLDQLSNNGLFSKIMHNVPSNVNNLQSDSKLKIYGWFGTVGETSQTITVK
jgi:hypothetical protein